MDATTANLKKELKKAGLSDQAIEAAWPAWWSDDAASSPSARAELRFTLARRLGLSPRPLLGERVEFVWRDDARFKRLSSKEDLARDALTSFGIAVAQHLLRGTEAGPSLAGTSADRIRHLLIRMSGQVDLQGLLALCWGIGIPVIHLRVFPLPAKSMQAMVVRSEGRFAILLGKDAEYPAPVAFTLAHELAHIILGHLMAEDVLVDVDELNLIEDADDEETAADRFALEILTGSPDPSFQLNVDRFNYVQLAEVALRTGPAYQIEPGTLALCLAYRTKTWPVAMAALRRIYDASKPVWREVNGVAASQIIWDIIGEDASTYLRTLMELPSD